MRRGYFGVPTILAAMALLCVLATSGEAAAGDTTRVSVASDGTQANASSNDAFISPDGRFVAFYSQASNLVQNDTNGKWDVFVHDRQTATTELVSLDDSGNQANGHSFSAGSMSADGRFVTFVSEASNLEAGDTAYRDVFVRDRTAGTTERVSANLPSGIDPNGFPPSISADGRFVAFESFASEGMSSDTNGLRDVFVYDRATKTTERVSVDNSERQANGNSLNASISADGHFVAFQSHASNLLTPADSEGPVDPSDTDQIFVRDRAAGKTELASVNHISKWTGNDHSFNPSISADGHFVAFESHASDLVPNDTNGCPPGYCDRNEFIHHYADVFVYDRATKTTERVSVNNDETQANGGTSDDASISANGRYVAFDSSASILAAGDTSGQGGLFVRDRDTNATQRASRGGSPSISADGTYVAFLSTASDLVAGDTNGFTDAFVHERDTSITQPTDSIAPTTTHAVSPLPNANGWNNSDVTVTLNAQDDAGGSGVKEIRYSATGAQTISSTAVPGGSATVNIPTEGTTTISYFSTDNAGNQESPAKTLTVKLDKGAPRVSGAVPTGTGAGRGTDATATFSEKMSPTSITKSTFKLFRCPSTTSTSCTTQITNVTVSPSTDGLRAVLNPYGTSSTLLSSRTRYKAVVTTGAKDLAGNALDQNPTTTGNQQKAWYFTTGS